MTALCGQRTELLSPVAREVHQAPRSSDGTLRLLSWNVFLVPQPAKNLHQPVCRASAMRDIFSSYDVLALQETFDRSTTKALGDSLLTTHPHQLLSLPQGGYTKLNGGISLLSRYPIISHRVLEYDACHGRWSDCRARRGAILATIDAPAGVIDVVVTHLDAGEAVGDHLARIAQLEQLRAELDEQGLILNNRPLILLGDMNIDGVSSRAYNEDGGLTKWAQMLHALGHEGAADHKRGKLPLDLFWVAHAPWSMTLEATERANTYACTATSLARCDDTLDRARYMERARYDYAFWWPAPDRAPSSYHTPSIQHVAFPGDACGLPYLSDHLAVQVELRSP